MNEVSNQARGIFLSSMTSLTPEHHAGKGRGHASHSRSGIPVVADHARGQDAPVDGHAANRLHFLYTEPMFRVTILALVATVALSIGEAQAQLRSIPAEAKRGELRHLQEMIVAIDGKSMRLAPGAQIRDPDNLIMLPASVPAGVLVKYTLDAQGLVMRVWVLSPFEAAQPDPKK